MAGFDDTLAQYKQFGATPDQIKAISAAYSYVPKAGEFNAIDPGGGEGGTKSWDAGANAASVASKFDWYKGMRHNMEHGFGGLAETWNNLLPIAMAAVGAYGYEGEAAGGAAGAETGSSVALGEAGGYGAAASAETAGTATALGEAGGYGATTAGAAATTSSGSTTAAAKSGVGKYATVNNAQKLYSGLQLAQALTAPKVPGAAPPPKASQTPGLQNARGNLSGGTPGVASTFLTGTAGVDPSLLNLGRSTLLGG